MVFLMVPNTGLTSNFFVEVPSSNPAAGLQLRGPSELIQAVPFLACTGEVPSSNPGRNTEYVD